MDKKNIDNKVAKKRNNSSMLTIFNLLKSGKSPKDIALILNIAQPTVSYHLRRLRALGSIRKLGYGTWETLKYVQKEHRLIKVGDPLPLGKKSLCSFGSIRGHGFKFRVKIPKLHNWSNREVFLKKNKISFELINRGYTYRVMYKNCKVWLNTSSIVIYFPPALSFFGDSAKDTEGLAFFEIVEVMKGLDSLFNTSFKINSKYQIKIFGKHQADVGNGLAKIYNRNKSTIKVYNDEGLWLLIDDSFKLDELETVGASANNDATKDMDNVIKPFFNSLKEAPFTAHDFSNLVKLATWHSENEKMYIKNIKSHLSAIQELRDSMKDIKDLVKVVVEDKGKND